MEFIESAVVNDAERRLLFTPICWLNKKKFEEYLQSGKLVQPYLDTKGVDGEVAESVESLAFSRVYIGKSIPDTEDNIQNVEDLGTVIRDLDTLEWVLQVPHGNNVLQIRTDFLVLTIENSNTFSWIQTSGNNIPKYALKGAVDAYTNDFSYVGRTCSFDSKIKCTATYLNSFGWTDFTEKIPKCFGKVNSAHDCMYAAFNKLELKFCNYEILCLNPTPNKLKILARDLVRRLTSYSNTKIELLNSNANGKIHTPNILIESVLKYPSCLVPGEQLYRNEKIVRADGKFELVVQSNGHLVVRSTEKINVKFERIICRSVNSIWLHNYQVLIHYTNVYSEPKVIIYRSSFSETSEYKLLINDQPKPNLVFRINGRDVAPSVTLFERDEFEKYYMDSNYHNVSHLATESD